MRMLTYSAACRTLAKRFTVTEDTFERLPRAVVMEWADEVTQADYRLRDWQYRFLIGEDAPNLHRTKLIERLDVPSLVAVSEAAGQSIKTLFSNARVFEPPVVVDQAVS